MIHSPIQNSNLRTAVLAGLKRRRGKSGGLQMTAMIDVIFLLLTFFVVTAKFRSPEAFLPVLMPQDAGAKTLGIIEPLRLTLSQGPDGSRITVGNQTVGLSKDRPAEGLAELANLLPPLFELQRRTADDPVELICENEVPWDTIVKVYDILQTLGMSNITFVASE